MNTDNQTNSSDYRLSHVASGDFYDKTLNEVPADALITRWHQKQVRPLVQRYFPSGLGRYVDFACGTGRITAQVADLAAAPIGIDVSASMQSVARTRLPNVEFILEDITSKDIGIAPVDLVTSFRFFGNAQQTLRISALNALAKMIKKDGLLITNNHRNPLVPFRILDRLTGGKGRLDLTNELMIENLNTSGFEVIETLHMGSWIWRSRVFADPRLADDAYVASKDAGTQSKFFRRFAYDTIFVARKR